MGFILTYIAPYTRRLSALIESSPRFKIFLRYGPFTWAGAYFGMIFNWNFNLGTASGNTPKMLGNSNRSPIYPFQRQPFPDPSDMEAFLTYWKR